MDVFLEYNVSYTKWQAAVLHMFNSSPSSAAYMRQWIRSALVQIMACRLFGAKPLSEPILGVVYRTLGNKLPCNFNQNSTIFIQENAFKMSSAKWRPFCPKGDELRDPFDISSIAKYRIVMIKHASLHALTWMTQTAWLCGINRVGQSREIYSNSVPLLPPHWPYPKRIRPPRWPRVAVASSIQNTKLFTWRTWPGAGAVPKCDWAARSQCGFKQRRADHTNYI